MASTENETADWAELARKYANTNTFKKLDEEELMEDVKTEKNNTNKKVADTLGIVTNGLSPLDL